MEETRADGIKPINPCCYARRQWLLHAFGAAVLGVVPAATAAAPSPAKLSPQIGDELAFPSWENDGRLVHATDVPLDGSPLVVYPRDPASGVVREKSRMNQILLLRVDPTALDKISKRHAAKDIIAYSGICTHAACAVSEWKPDTGHLICPCHGSEFAVTQHAKVMTGPAPRPLPALPIAQHAQHFVVSGKFSGKVGVKSP